MNNNKHEVEIEGKLIAKKELTLKTFKFTVHLIKKNLSTLYDVYTTISETEYENKHLPTLVFYQNDLSKEQAYLYYESQVQIYCK